MNSYSRSDNVQIEINFNETYEHLLARPRFRNTGRFVQTYMPASYTKHKDFIREQMPNALLNGKLKVTLSFYFKAPKAGVIVKVISNWTVQTY